MVNLNEIQYFQIFSYIQVQNLRFLRSEKKKIRCNESWEFKKLEKSNMTDSSMSEKIQAHFFTIKLSMFVSGEDAMMRDDVW